MVFVCLCIHIITCLSTGVWILAAKLAESSRYDTTWKVDAQYYKLSARPGGKMPSALCSN